MLEPGCRDEHPFNCKSISEVQHWCWVIRNGLQPAFPKVLGLRSGLCAGRSRTPNWENHLFVELGYCEWPFPVLTWQTVHTKLEEYYCLTYMYILLYAVGLRFPLIGIKGPCSNRGKQPQCEHICRCTFVPCSILFWACHSLNRFFLWFKFKVCVFCLSIFFLGICNSMTKQRKLWRTMTQPNRCLPP